jgi:hypothetical protein
MSQALNSAEQAAGEGQNQSLGEHLLQQTRTRRAEADSHADFAPPRRRARELQVGDVGADDEQHQRADSHQDLQQRSDLALRAAPGLDERQRSRRDALIGGGELARGRRGHRRELAARLLQRDARLQPREQIQRPRRSASLATRAVSDARTVSGTNRSKRRLLIVPANASGATPIVRTPVQDDGPADTAGSLAIAPSTRMREHRHRVRVERRRLLVAFEGTSERGPDAEHVEVVARHEHGPHTLGRPQRPRRRVRADVLRKAMTPSKSVAVS